MSSPIDLTDDDESLSFRIQNDFIHDISTDEITILSSDEDISALDPDNSDLISEDELPEVDLQKKSEVIRKLFLSNSKPSKNQTIKPKISNINAKEVLNNPSTSTIVQLEPEIVKGPCENKMIEGVNIKLPVKPYGCQIVLMSMLIKGIKRNQNCLLESPTGSGKTLALLCGALGWLSNEKKNIAQMEAAQYYTNHPELNEVRGAMDYITSPKKNGPKTPDKMFVKNNFGEKSIYDKPDGDVGQVRIHKRKRLNSNEFSEAPDTKRSTPEKVENQDEELSPKLRVPKIYYGARTHKQLQQVIKEFKRTEYCNEMKMSLLASREYSCIREFDKQLWGTKNDMCKSCVKKIAPKSEGPAKVKKEREETNCKYYDGRMRLNHSRLPPAFDLQDLENAGHELTACPYFAARDMAQSADIVFCPYNYLIEPTIRSSMRIDLNDNILIIDEAHNIEDICRDAASFSFTQANVNSAIVEFEHHIKYRYQHDTSTDYIDYLLKALKDWDYWFTNNACFLKNLLLNYNEATYDGWKVEHFVKTLDNHNIGLKEYYVFKENAQKFCAILREEPDKLLGISSATGTLLETMDTGLGYLFREQCKFMDDFKPTLVRTVVTQYNKPKEEIISLRLICMNPAVVFESLQVARCIILASGTLTPLISLHSELGTEFPIKVSPSHVIPADRVWIGTLTSHPDGSPLECKSRDTNQPETQRSLGEAVLWVCRVTPHGVLCFLPSYQLLNKLLASWEEMGIWRQLCAIKNVFQESRNVKDHNEVMEDYYNSVSSEKGAILFAVYRGKVSEGMDFKDHQARAVITREESDSSIPRLWHLRHDLARGANHLRYGTVLYPEIGVPYPNTFDKAVKAKMEYNDKYAKQRNLLSGRQWLQVQAYRALNQAVGRCVRHKGDWGAVLLVDARFQSPAYTEHLSKWVVKFLANNHHTYESLVNSTNSLESFMQIMSIKDDEEYNQT